MDTKTIINLTIYEIDDKTQFHTYTATWCGPCQRIKPKVIEIMSNFKKIEEKNVEKIEFKKTINDFIPFFLIIKDNEKVEGIQTSDHTELTKFLSRNKIINLKLDDDF